MKIEIWQYPGSTLWAFKVTLGENAKGGGGYATLDAAMQAVTKAVGEINAY